jgi:hypothetical protein
MKQLKKDFIKSEKDKQKQRNSDLAIYQKEIERKLSNTQNIDSNPYYNLKTYTKSKNYTM